MVPRNYFLSGCRIPGDGLLLRPRFRRTAPGLIPSPAFSLSIYPIRPNFMLLRFLLLAGMATGLTSCGTVANLLGTATAPFTNVLSSVTSGLRLSDSPEGSGKKSGEPKEAKPKTPSTPAPPASDDRQ